MISIEKQIQILNVQKKCYELFLLYTETIAKTVSEQETDTSLQMLHISAFLKKRALVIEQLQMLPFQVEELKHSSNSQIKDLVNIITQIIIKIETLDQKILAQLSTEKELIREQIKLLQIKKPAFKQYLSPRKYSACFIAEHV